MAGSLYPRFSEAEYRRRNESVRSLMRQQGVDALVIGGAPRSPDIFYLTNYLPYSPAWVVVPVEGEPVVFHHFFNHNPCAREMAVVDDIRWYGPSAPPTIGALIKERDLGRARIGVVGLASGIPYAQFTALQKELPEVTFEDMGRAFQWLRWVRSEEELEWIRQSAHLSDLACEGLEEGIRPGLTEHDLSLLMHERFVPKAGQLALQFMASTSMHAPDRFVPYQYPGNRVLQKGDVVITEITINYYAYSSQIHRPFAVAEAPTQLYQQLYDAAYECFEQVLKVLRPGVSSEEVVAATSVIEERDFTSYDSVVHGEAGKNPELGTPSAIHPVEPFTFRENMVVVVQPNPITRDQRAGLQLGAAVAVKAEGPEVLHKYPFKFPVCGT